jgi:hypothetical protein
MAAAPASTGVALVLVVGLAAGVAAAPTPVSDAEMRKATDEILAAVGAARHIPPRGGLERRVFTRAALVGAQQVALASAFGGAESEARARLWAGLGLVPAGVGTDVATLESAALEAGPTAFYDPARRRLAVPDWIPLDAQRSTLAHALAHALVDQRFGARQYLRIGTDGRHGLDGDAERARLAVVEGDATLAALEAFDPRGALTDAFAIRALAERLRGAPTGDPASAWMRANAAFAHADGLLFVARVRARAPWRAVDALWTSPPASSEQILHPEKYDAREGPVAVETSPPRALAGAWREAGADILGELGVRAWLGRAVAPGVAARAAAGWGGDRASFFVTTVPGGAPTDAGAPPSSFAAWRTVWDDAAEAEDFARAAASVLAQLAGDPKASSPADPHRVVARGAGGVYALAWRGADVGLLLGAPESALAALDELLPRPGARPRPRPAPARQLSR